MRAHARGLGSLVYGRPASCCASSGVVHKVLAAAPAPAKRSPSFSQMATHAPARAACCRTIGRFTPATAGRSGGRFRPICRLRWPVRRELATRALRAWLRVCRLLLSYCIAARRCLRSCIARRHTPTVTAPPPAEAGQPRQARAAGVAGGGAGALARRGGRRGGRAPRSPSPVLAPGHPLTPPTPCLQSVTTGVTTRGFTGLAPSKDGSESRSV